MRALYLNNPSRWLARAAKMRSLAESMPTHETRGVLLMLADQYAAMAANAQRRLADDLSSV